MNVFGSEEYGEGSDIMDAWLDCIHELDYRRAATNTSDMRLVSASGEATDRQCASYPVCVEG